MTVITAMVLVCGFNFGNSHVNPESINDAMIRKQKCITELAKCIYGMNFKNEISLIKCIGKR